jgi:hypothetical protein
MNMSDNVPEDSEAITSLLQAASERIRGELIAEIGMILAKESDQKTIASKIEEAYDKLLAPLIQDLLLLDMRFTSKLDMMGKSLEDLQNGGPGHVPTI